jgi:hypothetical protein
VHEIPSGRDPDVADVGGVLLIVCARRLLNGDEAALLVEAACREVGCEGPQLQPVGPLPLCLIEQRTADAVRLRAGQDIELIDPLAFQGKQAHDLQVRRYGDPALQLRDHPGCDPPPNLIVGVDRRRDQLPCVSTRPQPYVSCGRCVRLSRDELTGSDAVDLQQVAAILQEVTGRTVSRLVDANEGTTDPGSAQ